MGYPREDVEKTVREMFPDADAVAIVDEAIVAVGERRAADDAALVREERKAVEAEHDLGRSMHEDDDPNALEREERRNRMHND